MMHWGLDYASVDGNKPPNLNAFKQAGGSFLWLRASFAYYNASYNAWALAADPAFERDWVTIGRSGIVRGAYMGPAVLATHSAEEQVGVFAASLARAGGLAFGDFPPCLDVEFPQGIKGTGLDRAGVMAWIRAAAAAMRKEFGCDPIIYTSRRVWCDTDDDCLGNPPSEDLVGCPLWLARYAYKTRQPAVLPPPDSIPAPPCPDPWGDDWIAHQDQGDALGAPGFTSTTDVDRFRTMRLGSHGGHVKRLQSYLCKVSAEAIAVDGHFGPATEQALKAYQARLGFVDDGVAGPAVWAELARTVK